MFKEIRSAVNTAAASPSFFETGEKIDLELYCKSNADGTQIGDCPFAQFIQMVLLKKGISYNVMPTLANSKPAFITEKHDGKMPALVHKGVSMTDSLAIAEFIDKTYPTPSLTRVGAMSYQEVLEKSAGFFPAMSAYVKNLDAANDESLKAAVDVQLDLLDEIIRSTPGKYVCGIEMTLADLYLLPQLFHAVITMDHFKGYEFFVIGGEPTRPALENYLSRMMDIPEFNNKKAYYNADTVIYGWKQARGDKL
jgi:glutathione S-transferase